MKRKKNNRNVTPAPDKGLTILWLIVFSILVGMTIYVAVSGKESSSLSASATTKDELPH